MIRVTVLYPNTAGSWSDTDFYQHRHTFPVTGQPMQPGLVRIDRE